MWLNCLTSLCDLVMCLQNWPLFGFLDSVMLCDVKNSVMFYQRATLCMRFSKISMVDECKITDWLTIQINRQQNVLECGALLPLVWNMHFKKIQTGALLPVLDALNNCDDTSMVSVQVWQNVWMKTFNFNEWMVLRPQHSCSFWQTSTLQFWKM